MTILTATSVPVQEPERPFGLSKVICPTKSAPRQPAAAGYRKCGLVRSVHDAAWGRLALRLGPASISQSTVVGHCPGLACFRRRSQCRFARRIRPVTSRAARDDVRLAVPRGDPIVSSTGENHVAAARVDHVVAATTADDVGGRGPAEDIRGQESLRSCTSGPGVSARKRELWAGGQRSPGEGRHLGRSKWRLRGPFGRSSSCGCSEYDEPNDPDCDEHAARRQGSHQ